MLFRSEIARWLHANASDEAKPGDTEEQFIYRTRKKALGPFKRALWEVPTLATILDAQRATFDRLFRQLGVAGSTAIVERFVEPTDDPLPPPPQELRAAVRTGD